MILDKPIHRLAGTLTLLLVVVAILVSPPLHAQELWTPPERLPGYNDEVNGVRNDIYPPYLISDRERTIHAFNSLWVDQRKAVTYSQWSPETGWSRPVDVLLSPKELQAQIIGVELGPEDYFHVIFFGGGDLDASIYYSQAPARLAGRAPSWRALAEIGESALAPGEGVLGIDSAGKLTAIYVGDSEGVGIYVTRSLDRGESWSPPEPQFRVASPELRPTNLDYTIDESDRFQLVWSVANEGGNGEELYHAYMAPDSGEWSEPRLLGVATNFEIDTPTIIEHDETLFLIYHDDFPTTRWMRRSTDGGESWSSPVRLFDHVGSNGPASLVEDGDGQLHMFFGNRVGNPETYGLWHSRWLGDRWSRPEAIVSGPRVSAPANTDSFDPSYARAAIAQGNVALVTWRTDEGLPPNGVWASSVELPADPLPLEPLAEPPTATPLPATPTVETSEPRLTATPLPLIAPSTTTSSLPGPLAQLVGSPLVLSSALVSLFIGAVLVINRDRFLKRR